MSEQLQTSIYEREVTNPKLEAALDERQSIKADRLELNRRFRESDAKVKTLLEELELGDGAVIRIGRFLVSRRRVASKDVAFTTDPTMRLQISLLPE